MLLIYFLFFYKLKSTSLYTEENKRKISAISNQKNECSELLNIKNFNQISNEKKDFNLNFTFYENNKVNDDSYTKEKVKKFKISNNLASIENIFFKNNLLIKDYLLNDNINFFDEILEMYNFYNCFYEDKAFYEIDNLYVFEKFNSVIDNNDLKDFYNCKKIYDFLENEPNKIMSKNESALCTDTSENNIHNNDFENILIKKFQENTNDPYAINELYDNFQKCLKSKMYFSILKYIKKDLINVLKYALKYLHIENENNKNKILKIIDQKNRKLNFLSNLNELINLNFENKILLNNEKCNFIESVLYTTHTTKILNRTLEKRIYSKFIVLNNYINKNHIKDYELVYYAISVINQITDNNIRKLCIMALQNLFIKDFQKCSLRFVYLIVFLYKFMNEKDLYDQNWHEKFIKTFSNGYFHFKNKGFFNKIKNIIVKNHSFLPYKLYLIMNYNNIEDVLFAYEKLQENETQLQIINYYIDITNRIKAKIFGIKY